MQISEITTEISTITTSITSTEASTEHLNDELFEAIGQKNLNKPQCGLESSEKLINDAK